MTNRILSSICLAMLLSACDGAYRPVTDAAPDVMEVPQLKDTRLEGAVGKKLDNFLEQRIFSDFAKDSVMQEAEDAFKNKVDDIVRAPIGYWQGEFWGKLMLSASRAAVYRNDPDAIKYVSEEAHRLLRYQEDDGYLGTYADKRFITSPDVDEAEKVMGWKCDWCWNLWCRKYTMWGLVAAYEVTGEEDLLDAAVKSMDQEIRMLEEMGLKLSETGTPHFHGLPSCSVLKPLMQLYRITGYEKYLKFAEGIVADWDCADRHMPALITNAFTDIPVHEWYPDPNSWAKAYEMMSCLDGLLEYYRVTADRRCLEAVVRLQKNILETETNQLGSVGFNDQFSGGGLALNGISEPCDAIHWMRLNHDLFRITGDPAYVDVIETTFFNAFLAGVFRDGRWGARGVRSEGRHYVAHGQAMMKYSHCCVNNMPRGFMDIAQTLISRDTSGALCVNWYSDSRSSIGDCKVEVSGNYPVSDRVTVRISSPGAVRVKFRIPSWSAVTVVNGETAGEGWYETTAEGDSSFEIVFDMTPRIEDSYRAAVRGYDEGDVFRRRFLNSDKDLAPYVRSYPCARILRGPLILAKSKFLEDNPDRIWTPYTINRQGWKCSLVPASCDKVWGAWDLTLRKDSMVSRYKVCDYSSAGDLELPGGEMFFSIFF